MPLILPPTHPDPSSVPESVTLTAHPDPDSTFTNWSESSCSGTSCPVIMTQDLTVTATFTAKPFDYALTLNPNDITVTQGAAGSTTLTATLTPTSGTAENVSFTA